MSEAKPTVFAKKMVGSALRALAHPTASLVFRAGESEIRDPGLVATNRGPGSAVHRLRAAPRPGQESREIAATVAAVATLLYQLHRPLLLRVLRQVEWHRRQLQHGRILPGQQPGQRHDLARRELERVVMRA